MYVRFGPTCTRKSRRRSKRLRLGIIHIQADINLTLVEVYKESRQRRLVEKHRKYVFRNAILQYFIDTAANTTMLHSHGDINLNSLYSTYVQSSLRTNNGLVMPEINLTVE